MLGDVRLPSGRYILAVSGGVDSVVLLDILAKQPGLQLVVAHFDHGIRPDSAEDARFVGELASKYNLPFETRREELGSGASEELARQKRYAFLNEIANTYQAKLVTAHHQDDVLETIAINISRGTGWRGLAVLGNSAILRPLLLFSKAEIKDYASVHNLTWHEDSTNSDPTYLRNRLRPLIANLPEPDRDKLIEIWKQQLGLKVAIDAEAHRLLGQIDDSSRYFFINISARVALELLGKMVDGRLTRPQLTNLLLAIKTFPAGKTCQAGDGIEITFTTRNFTIKLLK